MHVMGENNRGTDLDALMPKPFILKAGGEEFRIAPIPVKKLMEAVRYVESNYDILDKAQALGFPENEGGVTLASFIGKEVYARLNGLIRIILSKEDAEKLTDEWCENNLSNAHYRAFLVKAIEVNHLDGIFHKAKEILGASMEASLRRMMQKEPATPA